MENEVAPLNRVGDEQGSVWHPDHTVTTPDGFIDAYQAYVEAGWGGVPFPEAYGGGGFPWLVGLAMQEMLTASNESFSMAPLLTQGAIDALLEHGDETQQRDLPPQDGHRRVGRHHEPVRAPGRLRRRRPTHPGRAPGRRHLPDHRHQDLDLLGRARHGRQHHPPRPGPHARRTPRHQGHLAVHRPQVPGRRRRHAGRAQRRDLPVDRAQARHQGQPHLRPRLRRRHRLPRRRGEPGHVGHVHHDEQRPAVGGSAGPGRGQSRLPGRGPVRQRAPAGPGGRRAGRRAVARSSSTPTCAACC